MVAPIFTSSEFFKDQEGGIWSTIESYLCRLQRVSGELIWLPEERDDKKNGVLQRLNAKELVERINQL